jgi:hypothetical protein
MKTIRLFLNLVFLFTILFATTSCKKNKPAEEPKPDKTVIEIPPPSPTALETQLFGDWICEGDTIWGAVPIHDNMYLGYHLNLTSSPYPSNSNFVTYFAGGLYGPGQPVNTSGTWKEVDGSPTYSHHVLVVVFPATVIMQVTANSLVLAQTDHPGNQKTFYFHK